MTLYTFPTRLLVVLRIYVALAVFSHIATWKQEITNLWNSSGETGNWTLDLLLRKPRAQPLRHRCSLIPHKSLHKADSILWNQDSFSCKRWNRSHCLSDNKDKWYVNKHSSIWISLKTISLRCGVCNIFFITHCGENFQIVCTPIGNKIDHHIADLFWTHIKQRIYNFCPQQEINSMHLELVQFYLQIHRWYLLYKFSKLVIRGFDHVI